MRSTQYHDGAGRYQTAWRLLCVAAQLLHSIRILRVLRILRWRLVMGSSQLVMEFRMVNSGGGSPLLTQRRLRIRLFARLSGCRAAHQKSKGPQASCRSHSIALRCDAPSSCGE